MSRSIVGSSRSSASDRRDLAVDHAVDPQRPGGRVDDGHLERGVDAVEVGVRREERRDAVDGEVGAGRHGWRRVHRRRQDERAGRRAARSRRAGPPGRRRSSDEPADERRAGEEPATRAVVGGRVALESGAEPAQHDDCRRPPRRAPGAPTSGVAVGRARAATAPTSPKPTSRAAAIVRCRRASRPMPAARTRTAPPIPARSASLSRSPNVSMANALSGCGARSTMALPTAMIGEADGREEGREQVADRHGGERGEDAGQGPRGEAWPRAGRWGRRWSGARRRVACRDGTWPGPRMDGPQHRAPVGRQRGHATTRSVS